jgi:hypothetical protein
MAEQKTMKMMQLKHFREEYDIPENTVMDLIYSKGFPAYKIGRRWYVDIPAFLKWREKEHRLSYKYA